MIGNCGGEAPERSGASLSCVLTWANAGGVIPRIFRERCRAAAFGGIWLHPTPPRCGVFAQFRALIGWWEGRARQDSNPRPSD